MTADAHATLREIVLARLLEAENTVESGRVVTAQALLAQLLPRARQLGDAHLLGWVLMLLGRSEIGMGRTLAAHTAASESYELLGACGDVSRQLWALNTCAAVLDACGDAVRFIEMLHRGLSMAVGPNRSAIRCILLTNLGLALCHDEEFSEAIQCLSEAANLAKEAPQRHGQWINAGSELACAHVQYAEYLTHHARHAEAAAQLAAAGQAMPTLNLQHWREFLLLENDALPAQVMVLSSLGRWAQARCAAAASLRFARKLSTGLPAVATALNAVAGLYRRAQKTDRAIAYELNALAAWREVGDEVGITSGLLRLAQLHAEQGQYDQALAFHKEMKSKQNRQNLLARALRSRLAALERQADRRRFQANEALVHAQRLSVIGRLIAQTHHALSSPIDHVQQLSRQLLDQFNADLAAGQRPDPASASKLAELSLTIDRAASLVSQLKLFSYRSTPQPMALSLGSALLSAWKGLAPHVSTRLADIEVADNTCVQAWADAQRLGIMLKVLLIELTQRSGFPRTAVSVQARIEAGSLGFIVLHIAPLGCAARSIDESSTLVTTLCMEIASEMGGSLHAQHDDNAQLTYRLELPDAQQQTQEGALMPELYLLRT
jgi:hypothetical protein